MITENTPNAETVVVVEAPPQETAPAIPPNSEAMELGLLLGELKTKVEAIESILPKIEQHETRLNEHGESFSHLHNRISELGNKAETAVESVSQAVKEIVEEIKEEESEEPVETLPEVEIIAEQQPEIAEEVNRGKRFFV
jgi:predicted  nucleic acid-binding Zn-ribbon protein